MIRRPGHRGENVLFQARRRLLTCDGGAFAAGARARPRAPHVGGLRKAQVITRAPPTHRAAGAGIRTSLERPGDRGVAHALVDRSRPMAMLTVVR